MQNKKQRSFIEKEKEKIDIFGSFGVFVSATVTLFEI